MATEFQNCRGADRALLAGGAFERAHFAFAVGWRRLLGFLGPGFLISVGYMDPGNWATDIAGGRALGTRCCS